MKRKVIAAAVVLGAVAVAFAFGFGNVFRDEDAEAVINISSGITGQCVANTVPEEPLQGHRWKNVTWEISDPSRCLPTNAEVELRFEGDDSPFLAAKPKDKTQIKRRVVPWARIKNSESYRPYTYKVWAVNTGGGDYQMEDPELEIVY